MAVFYDQQHDDEEDKKQGSAQQLGGQSAYVAQSATGGSSAPTSPGKSVGTGWTNLIDYLNVNKGEGQRMGSQVANKAVETAGVDKARETYDAGRAHIKGYDFGDMVQKVSRGEAMDADAFGKAWNAVYAGPESAAKVTGYGELDKATNTLQDKGNLSKSGTGRDVLLRETYNPGNYTRGESSFDNAFLGTGGGEQSLAELQSKANKAGTDWEGLLSRTEGDISRAKQATDMGRDKLQQDFRGKFQGLESAIAQAEREQHAANERAHRARENQAADLTQGEGWDELGIDDAMGAELTGAGLDARDLLGERSYQGLGDYLDPDTLAQYRNLQGLSEVTGIGGRDVVLEDNKAGQKWSETGKQNLGSFRDLDRSLADRVTEQQAAREASLDNFWDQSPKEIMDALGIGLDQFDYKRAQEHWKRNDPYQLDIGDVATDEERAQMAQILSDLGVDPGLRDLTDDYAEGTGWSFDKNAYLAALPVNNNIGGYVPAMQDGPNIAPYVKAVEEYGEDQSSLKSAPIEEQVNEKINEWLISNPKDEAKKAAKNAGKALSKVFKWR